MDLFKKIERNFGPLGMYQQQAEGYFIFPHLKGELGNRMEFNGEEMVIWSINNYLGLGNLPEVREADTNASANWGQAYPMGSRMMSGETELHNQLEAELAEFIGKESTFVLNYGYQGIMSTIDSLLGRHDVVVYDSECHACIMDALRMHNGKSLAYKHNDMEDFERQLGMKGDQGKLKEIAALKEEYGFRFLVDDAHGFGTLGATGAGAGEEQDVMDDIDVYFATFAKSMASIGAFIAGDKMIIDYLKYNMRSQMFAKSLPMAFVEGNLKRLELLKKRHDLREKLWENVKNLQNGLREAGFEIGVTNSCVTPVFLNGSVEEAMALVKDMRDNHKVFCSIVIYPVIPKGEIILRLIPTADHTLEDIELTIKAFSDVAGKLKQGVYKKLAEEHKG
jgi:glycine C-acetyltransferase